MKFLRSFFATLLALIVFTIGGFVFLSLILATFDSEEQVSVADNSLLVINLNKTLADRSIDDPLANFPFQGSDMDRIGVIDIRAALEQAAADDKIKGVVLYAPTLMGGFALGGEVRNALVKFKRSGKFILSYADLMTEGGYYISSVADETYVSPEGQEFGGTLVSDFWGPYNAVVCAFRQKCLAHLFRELEHTEKYKSPGKDWPEFAKKLRRLLGDAIRLWRRREELSAETYASRRDRIHGRLAELIETPWEDKNAKRLIKRFRRHQDELFTFLDQEGVPFYNNHAERSIRPAVIIRKNSHGSRSQKGANCQAVLMSVFRTLKQRGHDPIRTVTAALAEYLATGKLPPLPSATSVG